MNGYQGNQKLEYAQNVNQHIGIKKKGKITKTLICNLCGEEFKRTGWPSLFKIYKKCYCSKRCALIGAREEYRPSQGIILRSDGRKYIRVSNHPNANKNSQIPYSHLVMEDCLGRFLDKDEIVHHVDLNCANDKIENLELYLDGPHKIYHNNLRQRRKNGTFKN